MVWLESWAKAVVQASKTDQAERGDGDASRDDKRFKGGNRYNGIQERRRAMKASVRQRYAISTMATLWAEEITTQTTKMLG